MKLLKNSLGSFLRSNTFSQTFFRSSSQRKKFYKEAHVVKTKDYYEVDLDKRKLKSPYGNILKFPNEALAHAVALEWNSQPETIKLHQFPLTSLCFSAADNVEDRTPNQIVEATVKFLKTDTILYFMDDVPELYSQQKKEWGAVIEWVNTRFEITVEHTTGFIFPKISDNAVPTLTNHLLSFDKTSLLAFEKMSGVLKSVILTLAVIDRHLPADKAVELALLEQRFQTSKWGNVEWHHDVELHETIMKTAACYTYIHLINEVTTVSSLQENVAKS